MHIIQITFAKLAFSLKDHYMVLSIVFPNLVDFFAKKGIHCNFLCLFQLVLIKWFLIGNYHDIKWVTPTLTVNAFSIEITFCSNLGEFLAKTTRVLRK